VPPVPPAPPACTYSISSSGDNVPVGDGTGTVGVSTMSTCPWTAESNASWITITSGATGTGNGSVSYRFASNVGAARTGTLTIAGRTFTVAQAACSYSISPGSDNVSANDGAGTTSVSTTSTCAWTAASNASWITVASGATGTGNGTVSYRFTLNLGAPRTGTLTIAGRTFTVAQASLVSQPSTSPPTSCSYSIAPTSQKVDASAGSGAIAVTTDSTCTWTATSNESWIAVTSSASGTGNGTMTYNYSENTGKKDRKGTLTVAGRNATIEQQKAEKD
jgi:hypothetical protein